MGSPEEDEDDLEELEEDEDELEGDLWDCLRAKGLFLALLDGPNFVIFLLLFTDCSEGYLHKVVPPELKISPIM